VNERADKLTIFSYTECMYLLPSRKTNTRCVDVSQEQVTGEMQARSSNRLSDVLTRVCIVGPHHVN